MDQNESVQKGYLIQIDNLFFVAYLLLFLSEMILNYTTLSDSFGNIISLIARALYILFLGVCVLYILLCKTFRGVEKTGICTVLCLGCVIYYFSASHIFLDALLIICIAKGIDFEKFIKRAMILLAVSVIIIIGLYGIAAISPVLKERAGADYIRSSLGFSHPNTLGLLIFQFIAGIVIIEKDKIRIFVICLLFGIALGFYLITWSRTSFFVSCILLTAVLLYKIVSKITFTEEQINRIKGIIPVVTIILLVIVVGYFIINPEQLMSSSIGARIKMAEKYIGAYGINLFGHNILTGSNVALPGYAPGYSFLDNAEVWYLVKFGIVGFVIFFYLYFRMIKYTVDTKNVIFLIVAVAFLLYSLMENAVCRVPLNFMLVYAGVAYYKGKVINKIKSVQE